MTEQETWEAACVKAGIEPDYNDDTHLYDAYPALGDAGAVVAMEQWFATKGYNITIDCYGIKHWTVRVFDPRNEDAQLVDTAENNEELDLPLALAAAVNEVQP